MTSEVLQMELNKGPCSQNFIRLVGVSLTMILWFSWSFIKKFCHYIVNFGVITLLPKEPEVTKIPQYRPICLLNSSFKNFTKASMSRLNGVALNVIWRYILGGVVILHEAIHDVHSKKLDGVIFKIYFEKAQGKV
jgi:hypothetical protein